MLAIEFLALRVAIFAMAVSLSQGAEAESLAQAVSRAVQYFPEVQAALARREAASAQTGQARAEFFPSININAGEGRESSHNASTRTLGRDPTLTRQEADLSITQLIFDGGVARGQVRRFGARNEAASFALVDASGSVGLRAGQIFIEVRRLREQIAVARENLKLHESTLQDVSALAEAGRGRRADVMQADARRALASSALEQLAGQLSQSEAAFQYLTGRAPEQLDEPSELASKIPPLKEGAVEEALRAHPAIRSGEKELEAAQFDRESTRARMTEPRITLEAGASRNRDLDGVAGANNDRFAMLRLRYNLFRGFGDSERVRESEARFDEVLANLKGVRNEVARDVNQAWESLQADRARLPQLARYSRASAEVAEAYRLQFQLGQRSLLDVLNSENERFSAMGGYIAGRAAVAASELRLLASTGRLLEALGVELPEQPQAGQSAKPTQVSPVVDRNKLPELSDLLESPQRPESKVTQ